MIENLKAFDSLRARRKAMWRRVRNSGESDYARGYAQGYFDALDDLAVDMGIDPELTDVDT
jgi:hypothetical protein